MASRPDRIDVEAAREFLDELKATFVDARPRAAVQQSGVTIPGAIYVTPDLGSATDAALEALPRERLIIAFCDEPGHAASARVARRARELGLGDACILDGGLAAWQREEMPIAPIALFAPSAPRLDMLSAGDLGALCTLAFWLGLSGDSVVEWSDDRASMERALAGVPVELVERFRRFVAVQARIPVPEEHRKRVANLPPMVRERAAAIFGRRVAADAGSTGLADAMDEDDSTLLLRWLTFTGEIPSRQQWWTNERAAL